jgi:Arc/MetJ-type ribon-helix-helix transcriptional regulator
LLDLDYIGSAVMTGRVGSTGILQKIARRARQTAEGRATPYGAHLYDLQPMDFGEVVHLIGSFAGEHLPADVATNEFIWKTVLALEHVDTSLSHWTREGSLEGAVEAWDAEKNGGLSSTRGWQMSPPSLTPLIVLLTCLVESSDLDSSPIASDVDLLDRVMEEWRKRESQRLTDLRPTDSEMSPLVLAGIEDELVQVLAEAFVRSHETQLTEKAVREVLMQARVAGVTRATLPLWIDRLNTCGLFTVVGDRRRRWEFTHAIFAEFNCARRILAVSLDVETVGADLWRAIHLEMTESQRDATETIGRRVHVIPGATDPERWKLSVILRMCLLLALGDEAQEVTNVVDTIATQSLEHHQVVAEESFDCSSFACWLACMTGVITEPAGVLARAVLAPATHPGRELATLKSYLADLQSRGVDRPERQPSARDFGFVDWFRLELRCGFESMQVWEEGLSEWVGDADYVRSIAIEISESVLTDLEQELAEGPTAQQAFARVHTAGTYEFDPPWPARVLDLLSDPNEDEYIVAGVIARIGAVSDHLSDWARMLERHGVWANFSRYFVDYGADRELDLPTVAATLADTDEHEILVLGATRAARWLIGCMLPPVGMFPSAGSSFWQSTRPGLENLRQQVEQVLLDLGLSLPELFEFTNWMESDKSRDIRSDASDAVRKAVRETRNRPLRTLSPPSVLANIVADWQLPWVTRIWAARLIEDHVSQDSVVAALQSGARYHPESVRLAPHLEAEMESRIQPRRATPWFLRRYSLGAQTPREELLGEWGIASSDEGRVAQAGRALIAAARRRNARAIHAAYGELCRVRDPLEINRVPASDAADRAIAIAGHLAPREMKKLLTDVDRLRFENRYADPGDMWAISSEISWRADSRRFPWKAWLQDVEKST